MVGHTELRADSTSKNRSHVPVAASVARKDTGHANAQTKENSCPEMVKKQKHHSLSILEETTARRVTLEKGVIDTGCSRFLIGQNTPEKWERMLTNKCGFEHAEDQA